MTNGKPEQAKLVIGMILTEDGKLVWEQDPQTLPLVEVIQQMLLRLNHLFDVLIAQLRVLFEHIGGQDGDLQKVTKPE